METALVGLALPNLIIRLKELLSELGFKVQSLNDKKPVLIAELLGTYFGLMFTWPTCHAVNPGGRLKIESLK